MYTKKALGNLKNRYVAVLKKCSLINVFGSLAFATLLAAPTSAMANILVATDSTPLFNNGTLTGELVPANRNYFAMFAQHGDMSFNLTNDGTINMNYTTSGDFTSYAMYAFSTEGSHTLVNNGNIFIKTVPTSGYHDVYGMYAFGKGNHYLVNNSIIDIQTGEDWATGMYVEGTGNHTLINNGTITALSTNSAFGLYVSADGNHKLTNNVTITATSTNSFAYGLRTYSDNSGSHTLTNNGAITVKGYHNTYGMRASGDGIHSLTNKGIITATSTSDNAYGMYVSGSISPDSLHSINNTGIITATSANGSAFEVAGADSYSIGTYATTLRDWTNKDAVFASSGDVVNFADSTLILRPGTIAQGFEYGKEYEVTDMIVDTSAGSGGSSPATITGKIQNAVAEVPFLIANLNNTDPAKPKVSLNANVNEDTVTPTQLTKLSVGNVHNKVTRMANRKINKMIERRMARNLKQVSERAYEQGVILAGHHIPYAPTYQENTWAIYLDAYAGYTGNSEDNFGTHTKGMTLGGERAIGDKLNVGFAMDFSDSSTDAQQGLTADSTDITLAVNADYFINPNWYVSGNMALSFGENDMDYMMSPILYAEDDFNSQAFYMSVNTGYIYEINENNIIVPEFGLSYLYSQNDDITVDFAGSDVYDMRIKNDSFSALYANLMLTWQGQYDIALGTLRPSAGLGIRQNLTGSDFDSNVQALGSSFDTVVTEDDTTFLTNLGLEWQKGNFSMGISYSGGYGSEQQSHSGNVKFRYEF